MTSQFVGDPSRMKARSGLRNLNSGQIYRKVERTDGGQSIYTMLHPKKQPATAKGSDHVEKYSFVAVT